jgi:catechol 2,3-dioxygenase-like lactoylglutathione lyase family enzyme
MTNREPDAWPTRIGAITLFVEDVPAAKEFYRTIFGLPVHYGDADSAVFKFGDTLVNLLKATEAAELIEPEPVAPLLFGALLRTIAARTRAEGPGLNVGRQAASRLMLVH